MRTKMILKFVHWLSGDVKYYSGEEELTDSILEARQYVISPYVVQLTTRLRARYPEYDIKPEQVTK